MTQEGHDKQDEMLGGARYYSRIPIRHIVPNVITILSICAGMTGIRYAFEGRFELAVVLVLGAAFLDGIDGRIARFVNGQSRFGAEMDSLADVVNFGVAPALLLYAYTLHDAGAVGWIAALLYASGSALRLARFNTMLDEPNKPAWKSAFFTGVPAPAGAALAQGAAARDNIDALIEQQAKAKRVLAVAEAETTARATDARFRLTVDRGFTLKGAGTVVTGTVQSGRVAVGDGVTVSPSGLTARVRAIHAQNQPAEIGVAGQRCALNLAGDGITREAIHRGNVVLDPALHAPTARIDAELTVLGGEPKPISTWFPARLHVGAAETGARIVPLGGPIAAGARGMVQLVLDQPIAAAVGDRYILRDVSARRTIGGGRFLDLRAPARRRQTPERLALLDAAARLDPAAALAAMLEVPPHVVDLDGFARDRGLSAQAAGVLAEGAVVLAAGSRLALSHAAHRGLVAGFADTLARFHEDSPEMQGMGRERLRLALSPRLPKDGFAAFAAARIAAGAAVAEGAFLRLPGHVVRMSEADEALYARILPELTGEARFRPPRVRDMATEWDVPETDIRRVLRMAARQGRVDQIRQDHFFLRATTAEMVRIIAEVQAAAPDGWVTAAAFRDRVQNGRKVAIEILDFYDRHGVTLRRGDLRRINPHRADLFGG